MSLWEARDGHADAWITWARAPEHDAFWHATWPELSAMLPAETGIVIELGCGEGRVGRELLRFGYSVIGIERSPTLARAARSHTTPLTVAHADSARLPLAHRCADLVVSCMSLHDFDDLDATLDEAWRVLRPGGHLCVAMVHPFATAQDPATMHTLRPEYTAPYLEERRIEDRLDRAGLEMTFVSVHRPLSRYLEAFRRVGFVLDRVREFGNKPIPWLFAMRLVRPTTDAP